jgi:alpha-beta hydrolase superfamily lysophospholipase
MRKLIIALLVLSLPYALFSLLMYSIQDKIMFQPEVLPADFSYAFESDFKEINLKTKGKISLNALHFTTQDPKGFIVYYHGNAGNLSRWGSIVERYVKLGYDVLVMDYRGYGKSDGNPSEDALYNDAQLFYDYAVKHAKEEQIVVYGRSLGTALATKMAADNNPSKLVLETPFYSIRDVANTRFRYLPVQWLLKYSFPSFSYAKKVHCPTIIVHGTNDVIVPYASGERLYNEFNEDLTTFVTIPDGQHNNLVQFDAFHEAIGNFLK